MGTIADKLNKLDETKNLLKQRLTEKGLDVSNENNFYNLVNQISNIGTNIKKHVNITSSGQIFDMGEGGSYYFLNGEMIFYKGGIPSKVDENSLLFIAQREVLQIGSLKSNVEVSGCELLHFYYTGGYSYTTIKISNTDATITYTE